MVKFWLGLENVEKALKQASHCNRLQGTRGQLWLGLENLEKVLRQTSHCNREYVVTVLVGFGKFTVMRKSTLSEKFWWISLFVTDDAFAKLYVT